VGRSNGHGRSGVSGAERLATAVLTAVVMAAFASNSLLCRAALGRDLADAETFTTLRLATGALVLGLLARGRGAPADAGAGAREWPAAGLLFAYALGFSLAYGLVPAGTGALLLFAAVQVTMLAGGLLRGERPGLREWLGLLVSLAGLVVLTRPGLTRPDPRGAALMLGAGAAWGGYSLLGKGAKDALASNARHFRRAVPLALAASLLSLAWGAPRLTPAGFVLATVSGAFASGLGYAAWYVALRRLTAAQAAVVQLAAPPLAAAGGVLFLGEALTPRLLLAGAFILGGIFLALTASGEPEPTARAAVGPIPRDASSFTGPPRRG
jgi:drug/metabolite transporter (DMT)-like permease